MPTFIATAPFTYEAAPPPSSGADDEFKTRIGTQATMETASTSTSIGGGPLRAEVRTSEPITKGLPHAA